MDPISNKTALAAAGAAGGDKVYVDDVFSTYLYEGQNTSTNTINNGLDLAGEGGLVWIKRRDGAAINHYLFDTERPLKYLRSNSTSAQFDAPASSYINSYTSTGFVTGDSSNIGWQDNFASWTFRKAPGFFDVVTYNGPSSNNTPQDIPHNLGVVPAVIISKSTSNAYPWYVYHKDLGADKFLQLESTDGAATNVSVWDNTTPTATTFRVGNNNGVNTNNGTHVAYLFADGDQSFGTGGNESIIKCGSYTGSTTASIPIDLGWEPQWVLIKQATGSTTTYSNWAIFDNMRGIPTGSNDTVLAANLTAVEGADPPATGNFLDLTPTGFIVDPTLARSQLVNANATSDYIYIAIRRPHKPPEVATDVFNVQLLPANSASNNTFISAGFTVDMMLNQPDGAGATTTHARLLGNVKRLNLSSTAAEVASSVGFDYSGGYTQGQTNASPAYPVFSRAPGFFDVVAYTGTGTTTRQISHNLGSTPELIIVKRRNTTGAWLTWNSSFSLSNGEYILLNGSGAPGASSPAIFTSSAPTATYFNVSHDSGRNLDYDPNVSGSEYITYLFATLPGISKVGSYTGTGSDINVDCGFTAGARFVLIKRTDSTGDWYSWNTARGIVSGNETYVLYNSSTGEVTNTDYIDPLNAGFTVTSSAPAALNASGGTYIFLAIA